MLKQYSQSQILQYKDCQALDCPRDMDHLPLNQKMRGQEEVTWLCCHPLSVQRNCCQTLHCHDSAYQECIPRDEGPQGDVSSKGSFQASFTLALFIFVVGIFRHAITKGLATKWHDQKSCCQATTSFPCPPSLPLWVHKLFILPLPIILHILFTPPSSNHWDNMQFSWIKFPQSHSLLARFWFPSTCWWASRLCTLIIRGFTHSSHNIFEMMPL